MTNTSESYASDGFGHNHFASGRFFNPWSDSVRDLGFNFGTTSELFGYLTSRRNKDETVTDCCSQDALDESFPVHCFDGSQHAVVPQEGMKIVWLGHATCLIQFDGVTILTDPALSERRFKKRLRKPPCPVERLPPINIVLISHNHYDHLDYQTVKVLNQTQGSRIHWFVGLGLKKWFTDSGCENVYELDWWHESQFCRDVKIIFTPTQHWSKRTPFDTNKSLWGSWIVKGPRYSFIHLGDTGYCQTFKTIGDVHGPFELAAIPIGAYHPRSILKHQHVDPPEAVQIHKDLRSKKSFGIHWGTFPMGKEPFSEPPRYLNECLTQQGIPPDEFFTSCIGEVFHLFT